MLYWRFERTNARLHWLIVKDEMTGDPWTVRLGWRQRAISLQCLDRDEAEQDGMLKDGDWLMDGKWLAFHRDRMNEAGYHPWWRWGVAMGRRMWTLCYEGVNRAYDSPEAVAIREADEARRQAKREGQLAAGRAAWEALEA